MTPGEVVLILFPFTDTTSAKVRPALVVSSVQQLAQGPAAIFMAITATLNNQKPTDFFLDQDHPEFAGTGLKKPSLFRAERIHCLQKSLAVRRLGMIGPRIRQVVSSRLRMVLGF